MQSIQVHVPKPIDKKERTALAPKLTNVSSTKIAFLDNLKPQSDHVLYGISEKIEVRISSFQMFRKIDTPTPLPEDVVEEIKKNYHGMVTGVGD